MSFRRVASSFTASVDNGSEFYLYDGTLTTSSFTFITASNAGLKQEISFWLQDVSFPYSLLNSSGEIFTTGDDPVKVNVIFDGTDWDLLSYKTIQLHKTPDDIENLVNWYKSDASTFDSGDNHLTGFD